MCKRARQNQVELKQPHCNCKTENNLGCSVLFLMVEITKIMSWFMGL